jgi:mRNA-degrading endonuclease YafQ of YafQ-DinJ toxin-antitoxin module
MNLSLSDTKYEVYVTNNFKKNYKKIKKQNKNINNLKEVIYKYNDDKLNLLLVATGSHCDLFI